MICICLASRGLVFTQTMQSIFDGMGELSKLGIASKLITSHDLPIPDAQNYVTETALQDPNVQKLFFIEEDMYLFPKDFIALCTSDADISTMQYNDKNGSPHGIIHYNEAGEVLWGGLGATIVKRIVFEKISKPYFQIDTRYRIIKKKLEDGKLITNYEKIEPRKVWNEEKLDWETKTDDYKYGGNDIGFFTRAREVGFKPVVVPGKAHHFDLVALGEKHTNNGAHQIRQV